MPTVTQSSATVAAGDATVLTRLSATWAGGNVDVAFYPGAAINCTFGNTGEFASGTAAKSAYDAGRIFIMPATTVTTMRCDPSQTWFRCNSGTATNVCYWNTIT
jgi:hypothetical protein